MKIVGINDSPLNHEGNINAIKGRNILYGAESKVHGMKEEYSKTNNEVMNGIDGVMIRAPNVSDGTFMRQAQSVAVEHVIMGNRECIT